MSPGEWLFVGVIVGVLICAFSAWLYGCPSTRLTQSAFGEGYQPKAPPMPACRPPRPRTSEDYARDELERLHDFLTATIDNEWGVEQAIAFSRAQLDLVEAELKKLRIPQPPAPPGPRTMGH